MDIQYRDTQNQYNYSYIHISNNQNNIYALERERESFASDILKLNQRYSSQRACMFLFARVRVCIHHDVALRVSMNEDSVSTRYVTRRPL